MEFDINKLGVDFRNTVDWMLANRYGEVIKADLQLCKTRKNELEIRPDSLNALRSLIEFIVTGAWYYKKPGSLDSEIDIFVSEHGENIRRAAAINELSNLVGRLTPPKIRNRGKASIQRLLTGYHTLREFTQELYDLAKEGRSNEVLGEKGRDNYLRDFGHWDRIPMDRHEMRFVIRSGIYHFLSVRGKNDPLQKSSLHDALTRFCSVCLSGKVVEGIDLGSAPGIVDAFIWSYCAKERYAICGSTPRCKSCQLRDSCLLGRTSIQRLELGEIRP